MKIFTKLIIFSLLCAAIYSQSHSVNEQPTFYTENGQSYLYIYG